MGRARVGSKGRWKPIFSFHVTCMGIIASSDDIFLLYLKTEIPIVFVTLLYFFPQKLLDSLAYACLLLDSSVIEVATRHALEEVQYLTALWVSAT